MKEILDIKNRKINFGRQGILFSYFIGLILLGSILLSFDFSHTPNSNIKIIDAIFTATSAVCVTGLITVDTSLYSMFGKGVIAFLIQFGGLGIITFTTFVLTNAKKKRSFTSSKLVRSYFIASVEFNDKKIMRNIVIFTFSFELIGATILFFSMRSVFENVTFFDAIFISISAFCNAGFSVFDTSVMDFSSNYVVLTTIMLLIITGGLGFVVFTDILQKGFKIKKHISVHSKVVLFSTFLLIVIGAVSYFFSERNQTMANFSLVQSILNSFFQSVTTRTAGFNSIDQGSMTTVSKLLTLPLMFIGGGPGSIAGGIKVTTFALIIISIFKPIDTDGSIDLFKRKISGATITRAYIYFVKGIFFVFISFGALIVSEIIIGNSSSSLLDLLFETVSAIGTVGLSLGLTPLLTTTGKIIIIISMFAGRVGLISLAISPRQSYVEIHSNYPQGEILIG